MADQDSSLQDVAEYVSGSGFTAQSIPNANDPNTLSQAGSDQAVFAASPDATVAPGTYQA